MTPHTEFHPLAGKLTAIRIPCVCWVARDHLAPAMTEEEAAAA